jgi:hypothetical protein
VSSRVEQEQSREARASWVLRGGAPEYVLETSELSQIPESFAALFDGQAFVNESPHRFRITS